MADAGHFAVHHTMVLVDVEGFGASSRTLPHQVRTRAGLYAMVAEALAAAGVPWDECYHEDRGDSVFVLVPPRFPKAPMVEELPGALARAARGHNATSHSAAATRLRLAIHAGEVAFDDHGVTSTALTTAFRLLDAEPLKQALVRSPGVVGMIVSRLIFDDVVRHSARVDLATFRPVDVTVKEVHDRAWIALPDCPYPPDSDSLDIAESGDPAVLSEPLTAPIPLPVGMPAVHQGNVGQAGRYHPVNVSGGSGRLSIRGADFAGGNIDKRRNIRIGTGGLVWLVIAAVVLLGGATGAVVAASSGPPDPTTIGTERGAAGAQETAEAVLDAFADRDVEQLCGLMSDESKMEFEDAIPSGTWTFGKCDQGMDRWLDELYGENPDLEEWIQSLAVEDIELSDLVGEESGEVREDSAAEIKIVSAIPGVINEQCRIEELDLNRENGRWVADIMSFSSVGCSGLER